MGGGKESSLGLSELSKYCSERLSVKREIKPEPTPRPFDAPYYITDNSSVRKAWDWQSDTKPAEVLDSITTWAYANRPLIESGF